MSFSVAICISFHFKNQITMKKVLMMNDETRFKLAVFWVKFVLGTQVILTTISWINVYILKPFLDEKIVLYSIYFLFFMIIKLSVKWFINCIGYVIHQYQSGRYRFFTR